MHPHTFFSTLFEYDKRDEVFVVMSFSSEFNNRWESIILPAIEDDLGFVANRVDYNVSGESVVHDILDGIAHSRLILADITSSHMRDVYNRSWPQRNGNVMWELGIAHAMRLPDEVTIIRSDHDDSIFDLTQFRAFQYDPSDVANAREFLKQLMLDRLRSIDQSKSDHVRRCVDALDPYSTNLLLFHVPEDGSPTTFKLDLANSAALPRLHEMGILRVLSHDLTTSESGKYCLDTKCALTPLGKAVLEVIAKRVDTRNTDERQNASREDTSRR